MATFIKSVGFALNGIKRCYIKEAHFKIHATFTFLAIVDGFAFNISNSEWLVVSICIASVLTAELFNTAIEELCNIIHREQHPGIKLIKDMSAAAVLVLSIAAAICGSIIFLPKLISFINSISQ